MGQCGDFSGAFCFPMIFLEFLTTSNVKQGPGMIRLKNPSDGQNPDVLCH